jgi:anti-anti-sigma factor
VASTDSGAGLNRFVGQCHLDGGLGVGDGRVDDRTGLSPACTTMPNSVQARTMTSAPRHQVGDRGHVSFIDSAGLSALVGTANRADAHGGSLYTTCSRPKIRKLFRLTGLDRRIPLARILDEVREALEART